MITCILCGSQLRFRVSPAERIIITILLTIATALNWLYVIVFVG